MMKEAFYILLNSFFYAAGGNVQLRGRDIQSGTIPKLHLLIPNAAPSLAFCKSLASIVYNSYQSPILVNWNQSFYSEAFSKGAKIRGIHQYLSSPEFHSRLDDYVLIVDGYDAWFQLPPDVLIKRFERIVQKSIQDRGPTFKTKVLFGANKECWPNDKPNPPYSMVPLLDLEGNENPENHHTPPCWLDSRTAVGNIRDVLAVYSEAWTRFSGNGNEKTESDQNVLAEIFADQEIERNLEQHNMGIERRFAEIGMAVDSENAIFMAVTNADEDFRFYRNYIFTCPEAGPEGNDCYSNYASVNLKPQYIEVIRIPMGYSPTDQDILDLFQVSNFHYSTYICYGISTLEQSKWYPTSRYLARNIILGRNIKSRHIPVAMHFSETKDPSSDIDWWQGNWWNWVGKERDTEGGNITMRKAIWGRVLEMRKSKGWSTGAETDKGQFLQWEEICGVPEWHAEMFGGSDQIFN